MKKIMRKILFILLFLHTTVPSVIRADFPLSFKTAVTLFLSDVTAPSFYKWVKNVRSNPGPYINSMHRGVNLTCDYLKLTASVLGFLYTLGCIEGTLTGRYKTVFR